MSSQEGMNESCKLIAKAKELIQFYLAKNPLVDEEESPLTGALNLLNEAIDKLTSC